MVLVNNVPNHKNHNFETKGALMPKLKPKTQPWNRFHGGQCHSSCTAYLVCIQSLSRVLGELS